MTGTLQVGPGIYTVAGPGLSDDRDALGYLVEDSGELVLIDCGAGPGYTRMLDNIHSTGHDPLNLTNVIATHAHIDHIGSLSDLSRDYNVQIIAHVSDAPAIETADREFTAADWYGIPLKPTPVHIKVEGEEYRLPLGDSELICVHTPGHTPGSMSVYLDRGGLRYLFGQDIHGPFNASFRSNMVDWRRSMQTLIDLEADVLLEGHFGIMRGRDEVVQFITRYLKQYGG